MQNLKLKIHNPTPQILEIQHAKCDILTAGFSIFDFGFDLKLKSESQNSKSNIWGLDFMLDFRLNPIPKLEIPNAKPDKP